MASNRLAFKGLPFVPVMGQVIYIEMAHDEKINQFIRNNYEWLKQSFRKEGLTFCYLPLLMQDLINYYRPNINTAERERLFRKVPDLSEYLVKGTDEQSSSLIYMGNGETKDGNGNTIMHSLPIHTHCYLPKKITFRRLAHRIKLEINPSNLVFKNIPLGMFCDPDDEEDLIEIHEKTIQKPEKPVEEKNVISPTTQANQDDGPQFSQEKSRSDNTESPELPHDPKLILRKANPIDIISDTRYSIVLDDNLPPLYVADEQFDKESMKLVEEIRQRISALEARGVNTMFLYEMIDVPRRLSHLRITPDYRIYLPDYNNVEIQMAPLPKAVYLFFLRHPDGVRFKELPSYYDELLQIYAKLRPMGINEQVKQSIRDVTNPFKNSINEKCARIREAFVAKINDRLAQYYYIRGKSGEPKRIMLSQDMIEWES